MLVLSQSTMLFNVIVTILVATSCVYGQLTQEEVDQFTTDGGCPDPTIIGAEMEATMLENGDVYIETNHVPNHYWETVNENTPISNPSTYTFTRPERVPDGSEYCLNQGAVGFAKNGVYIFNPTDGRGGNAKETEVLDSYHGHAAEPGDYHYHYLPDNAVVWNASNPESQFIGVAFDGYPIYSQSNGVHDPTELDVCHGKEVDGRYRYIVTDQHYPYFLGCFRGRPQYGRDQSPICSGMTVGQACTCRFGITFPNRKRQLLDLIEAYIEEDKRQRFGRQTLNCGVLRSFVGAGRKGDQI